MVKKILRGKKAWIRIVEAVIAVLLVASVFTFILVKQKQRETKEEINQLGRALVSEISNNNTLRTTILNMDLGGEQNIKITSGEGGKVYNFLLERIPDYLEFEARVCTIENAICGIDYIEKELYVHEIIISSDLQTYAPRRLKLYMWEK